METMKYFQLTCRADMRDDKTHVIYMKAYNEANAKKYTIDRLTKDDHFLIWFEECKEIDSTEYWKKVG